jgi:MoaA/NifB/PqqE/SkfB family radical SAM enzyme
MNLKNIINNPSYYWNRVLQEVDFRAGIPCSRPSSVWLKITERCNCRCLMCDIWKKNRDPEGELNTSEWKDVLSGLRQWLGKRHIWFTGGEPFLRKDCIELIEYGSSIDLPIGVITNGILLKPDQMPQLLDAGLKEYHVSIDSVTPEIHDHLRGVKGAHKRATENVLALREAAKNTGREIKIVTKSIITGVNHQEIVPLVNWAEQNGFDEIKFQPIESNLEGKEDCLWFENSPFWPKGKELDRLILVIECLIRKREKDLIIHNSVAELENMKRYFTDPVSYYEQTKAHTLSSDNKSLECRSSMGLMEILSRGGLRICRFMPPQGDIRTITPRKLWRDRPRCWKNPDQFCFKNQ